MEISHQPGKSVDSYQWDEFIRHSPHGSLYSRHAYLSASYPEWEAMILQESGEWKALFPVFPKSRYGIRLSWQPLFSQYTGIMLPPLTQEAPLAYYETQKQLLEGVLARIPAYPLFSMQFSPAFDYPLPFVWENFQLFCRYTYQLSLNPEPAFHKLRKNLQRNIRKAEKQGWTVRQSQDTGSFVPLMEQTLGSTVGQKQLLRPVTDITNTLLTHGQGALLASFDKDQHMRAGILLGWDETTTYYLMGAADPQARQAGALSRLLWEGIKRAADHTSVFDFEGSMQRSLEHFFRGFGARPVPYLRIYRNQLPLKRLWAMFGY